MFGLSKVERIKKHYPLAEFIASRGVELKKNGVGLVGLCPFHADTNASLRVTPEKGLWHCFGCGKGGDAITFLEQQEGITNAEAIERLFRGIEQPGAIAAKPAAKTVTLSAAPAIRPETLLADICRLQHEVFLRTPAAHAYLEGRGLQKKELWRKFELGYSDGAALKTAASGSADIREQLQSLGLLNEKGNETFYKCILFPLRDDSGAIVGLYGRSIEGSRHVYLKGQRRGLFNAAVAGSHQTIILTESILDALSLIELGFENVLPLYGVNGLTDDHRSFLERHRFAEIILCLDNDDTGHEATLKLSELLFSLTAKISAVEIPNGIKDPNDYLQNGGSKEDFAALLAARKQVEALTPALSRREREEEMPAVTKPKPEPQPAGLSFHFEPVTYKVKGISAITEDSMRVVVTAEHGGKFFRDRVDLYASRARASFATSAAGKLGLQESKLEDDLQRLSVRLEALPKPKGNEATHATAPELSSADKAEALAFLKRPDLLHRITQDITACGYVGQDTEKLLLYLSATSRILPKPFHVSIRSTSSSGKSELMEKVVALFPPEAVELYSRISAQSLYYMETLRHKIMILDEKSGAEDGAETALRSLMSRGRLSLAVVQRDPQTGISKTVDIELEGPCVVWDSSTEGATEDNQNRVFELWLTESREQTRLIHEAQREEFSPDSHKRREKAERLRRLHQNAQRLLKPLSVVIPFRRFLDFPDHLARAHRDHQRLLSLLAVIALLHQHQREVKPGPNATEQIEALPEDYAAAWRMTEPIFRAAYAHVPRDAKDLFGLIHAEVSKLAKAQGLAPGECSFTRREVREWSAWSEAKARRCLCELMRMEYITPILATRGRTGYLYRLNATPADLEASLQKFTTPEELRAKIAVKSSKTPPQPPTAAVGNSS